MYSYCVHICCMCVASIWVRGQLHWRETLELYKMKKNRILACVRSSLSSHCGRDAVCWFKLPWLPLHHGLYPELWAKMNPYGFSGKDFFYHNGKQRTTAQEEVNLGARFSSTWNKCVFCCCLVNQLSVNYMLLASGDAEFYNLADIMLPTDERAIENCPFQSINLCFIDFAGLLFCTYMWCLRDWLVCYFKMERKPGKKDEGAGCLPSARRELLHGMWFEERCYLGFFLSFLRCACF